VDETNATVGLARLHTEGAVDAMLARIQNDLFDLGADLCVPETRNARRAACASWTLRSAAGARDRFHERRTEPADIFCAAGGTAAAAYLHLARTVRGAQSV